MYSHLKRKACPPYGRRQQKAFNLCDAMKRSFTPNKPRPLLCFEAEVLLFNYQENVSAPRVHKIY